MLNILNRSSLIFENDIKNNERKLTEIINSSNFLIIGGAGSIGQAVVKEIFKRNPNLIHVVDISENNLVELVRDLRSSLGYISGEFKTFAIDVNSIEFDMLTSKNTRYDYVLNLAALKHVRSGEDAITLMRLVQVNVLNVIKTISIAKQINAKKYFAVSTDKATDPVNLMGASKKIMELFLNRNDNNITTSTARFANVGFSDGSLLYGFKQRLSKEQPLAVPKNIFRYFITDTEAGKLCLLSCILGTNRDLFIPTVSKKLKPSELSSIAERFLHQNGFKAYYCSSEAEARQSIEALKAKSKWPIFLSEPNTSGEKEIEKFYTEGETVDFSRFEEIGVIRNDEQAEIEKLDHFVDDIEKLKAAEDWKKEDFVNIFKKLLPNFTIMRSNHTLNNRM